MQIASCLLVTAALAVPGPGDTTATDCAARPAISAEARQPAGATAPQAVGPQTSATRPASRRFGVGASVSGSTGGFGANARYWLGSRLGIELNASWYRPSRFNSPVERTSAAVVAPSAIFMLSDFDDTKDVNLRPYLGGGINYAKASIAVDSTPEERDRASGAGGQAFGGLELTFKEAPNVSLDFQVIHRWQPSGATGGLDGTRVNGAVYFYF